MKVSQSAAKLRILPSDFTARPKLGMVTTAASSRVPIRTEFREASAAQSVPATAENEPIALWPIVLMLPVNPVLDCLESRRRPGRLPHARRTILLNADHCNATAAR